MMLSSILFTAVIGLSLWFVIQWPLNYIRLARTLKAPDASLASSHRQCSSVKEDSSRCFCIFVDVEVSRFAKQYEKEGLHVFWIGPIPSVNLHKAEIIEEFLNSTKHTDKSQFYTAVHAWLGMGLLTSTGDKWKTRRKMLTPAFHFQILNDFVEVFCEHGDVMAAKLEEKAAKGQAFDIYPYLAHCALDIICETAMGERMNGCSGWVFRKSATQITSMLSTR